MIRSQLLPNGLQTAVFLASVFIQVVAGVLGWTVGYTFRDPLLPLYGRASILVPRRAAASHFDRVAQPAVVMFRS